jgi:hypothetical protein
MAIAAIWWWSTRRSGQAPGNSELRESSVVPLQSLTPAADDRPDAHDHSETRERAAARQDRSISPLEPLSIRTGDFERMPLLDLSMTAKREPEHERIEDVDYLESSMSAMSADSHPSIDVEIDMGGEDEPAASEPQAADQPRPAQRARGNGPCACQRDFRHGERRPPRSGRARGGQPEREPKDRHPACLCRRG